MPLLLCLIVLKSVSCSSVVVVADKIIINMVGASK